MTRQEWIRHELEQLPFLEISASSTIRKNKWEIASVSDDTISFISAIYSKKVECQLKALMYFGIQYSETVAKIYNTIVLDNVIMEMSSNLKVIDDIRKELKPMLDGEEIAAFYDMLSEVCAKIRKIIILYRRVFTAEYKAFMRWLLKNNKYELFRLLHEMDLCSQIY